MDLCRTKWGSAVIKYVQKKKNDSELVAEIAGLPKRTIYSERSFFSQFNSIVHTYKDIVLIYSR